MDATHQNVEGEPTVPIREILLGMLVRWRETAFHLVGVWVRRPRHTQEPMGP